MTYDSERARGVSLHARSTARGSLAVFLLLVILTSLPVAYFKSDDGVPREENDGSFVIDGRSILRREINTVLLRLPLKSKQASL